MKKILTVLISLFTAMNLGANSSSAAKNNFSANEALAKLKAGNANFVNMKLVHPNTNIIKRESLINGQHPFAVVVGCSDSRVPVEMIFDQGLGDIFVVRNAGNIVDNNVLGSVEYAVKHLNVKIVVVMGHQFCGAVGSAMSTAVDSSEYIENIKKEIKPAIDKCQLDEKLTYENAIKTNARIMASKISTLDSTFTDYMKKNNVLVIPAYYNLDTGKVDFLTNN